MHVGNHRYCRGADMKQEVFLHKKHRAEGNSDDHNNHEKHLLPGDHEHDHPLHQNQELIYRVVD